MLKNSNMKKIISSLIVSGILLGAHSAQAYTAPTPQTDTLGVPGYIMQNSAAFNQYLPDYSQAPGGYFQIQPHTMVTNDERGNIGRYRLRPEDIHEIVDLRADLNNVTDNVARLSQQQFNGNIGSSGSVSDPRCDSLDARVRTLENQLAMLQNNSFSASGVGNVGSGGVVSSDDPIIQTLTKRISTIDGAMNSYESSIGRILKFLKLK